MTEDNSVGFDNHNNTIDKLDMNSIKRKMLKKMSLLAGVEKDNYRFLDKCVDLIGNGIGYDRIFIVRKDEVSRELKSISRWEKGRGLIKSCVSYGYTEYEEAFLIKEFDTFGEFMISDVENYIDENIRVFFESFGYKSLLLVPFYIKEDYGGMVGFGLSHSLREWSDDDRLILESFSILVSQSISKDIVEKELKSSKERSEVTLLSISDGIVVTDEKGKVVLINKVAQDLIAWPEEEALGRSARDILTILHQTAGTPLQNYIDQVLEKKEVVNWGEPDILITKDNKTKFIDSCASPVFDSNGSITGVVMVIWDMTDQMKKEEKIRYISQYDVMTGLYNRSYFEDTLESMDSEENYPIAIVMGDLNGLKITNDVFGHHAGDSLLKEVGNIINESTQKEGISGRWGGDEFIIAIPKSDRSVAEKLCYDIKNRCFETETMISDISISLGYSVKRSSLDDIHSHIKIAEDFMYKKKLLEGKSMRRSILVSMQKALSEKSHETDEHAKRLEVISRMIGRFMDLSSSKLDELQLLASLHDVGKISIKDEILLKKDKLSDLEWLEMKKHPEAGYRIVRTIPELAHIGEYILCHHERWDGRGYPQGLKGDEIPLLSRIIAVADAYDAMTNNRSYREAMDKEEALDEIKRNSGTQFDPDVVEVFLNKVMIR